MATQIEVELYQIEKKEEKKRKISPEGINTLLYALNHLDEKVRFYSLKTIENICILTTIAKNYFANNEKFILKTIEIFNSQCENQEIRTSALNTASHIIRLNPSIMKYFIEKMDNIDIVIQNNIPKNQQFLINCLLFGINEDKKNLKYIDKSKVLKVLLNIIETNNINIIKAKCILLIILIYDDIK